MRRDQLEHAIRTACQIIERPAVVVVGSQASSAPSPRTSYHPKPPCPLRSTSCPSPTTTTKPHGWPTSSRASPANGRRSKNSTAFSIDGVDHTTAVLPAGWRDRLVKVSNANTAAPGGKPRYTGWCLDKEDLCVAKLCAFREKDQNFVAALLDAELVDPDAVAARLAMVPAEHRPAADRGLAWLAARR